MEPKHKAVLTQKVLTKPTSLCSLKIHQNYYSQLLKDHLSNTINIDIIYECILDFVCGDLDTLESYEEELIKRFLSKFDVNKDKITILDESMEPNKAIDCIESFKEKKSNACNIYSVWYKYNVGDSHKYIGWEIAIYIGQFKTILPDHGYLYFSIDYKNDWEKDSETYTVSITLSTSLDIFLEHAIKLKRV